MTLGLLDPRSNQLSYTSDLWIAIDRFTPDSGLVTYLKCLFSGVMASQLLVPHPLETNPCLACLPTIS